MAAKRAGIEGERTGMTTAGARADDGEARERGPLRGRPRLLFLCQTMPYPPDGGAPIRTYNVMRLLARAFDITAVCFHRGETGDDGAALERNLRELGKIAEVEAFPFLRL